MQTGQAAQLTGKALQGVVLAWDQELFLGSAGNRSRLH
jgi:hypothetical protein